MLFWKRPPPAFRPGHLCLNLEETCRGGRYLVIFAVRWIRPAAGGEKRWVYDGLIVEASDGEIVVKGGISGVPESDLHMVTWGTHNRHLLDPRLLATPAAA